MTHLREHWGGVFAALVMTLLVSSPLIAFPFYAGDKYQGINIAIFASDENIYLTRAKEVLEGHYTGQPELNSHKDEQDPTFSSIERILLFPLTVFGFGGKINVVTAYNIYNFIGVFALVLVLYTLAYSFSRDKLLSIAAAMFVVGGYSIVYNKTLFYSDFNIYLRSDYPYMASLPFFLMCFFLWQARAKASYWYAVAAGLLFALLANDYFFGWTFALAFGSSLFLFLLLWRDYRTLPFVAAGGAIGLILAIPVFVQYWTYLHSAAGTQLSYFLLSSVGHKPVFSLIGAATFVLFCIYLYFKRKDRSAPFIAAAILASWIALNQQIVTGRYIQYGHYYWYFIVPVCILVSVYMAGMLIPHKWRAYFSIALICIVLLNTVVGQYRSFFTTTSDKLRYQQYVPILRALHASPKGTVLTAADDEAFHMLVTIETDDDIFWGGNASTYNVPLEYMKDTLLTYLYLNKNSRKDFVAYLEDDWKTRKRDEYIGMYETIEGYYSGLDYYAYRNVLENDPEIISPVRAKLLSELRARYAQLFPTKGSARSFVLQNEVRYLLWDKQLVPEWDISVMQPLTLLATSTDLYLYQITAQ